MRFTIVTLLSAVLMMSVAGNAWAADPVRDAVERARDHKELRQDRRATEDDLGDRLQIDILKDRFETAVKAADTAEMTKVDDDVMTYLKTEAKEAGIEITQAERERWRDHRELRSDRREARENRRSMAKPGVKVNDRHDRRDDRRDLRDDRDDAKEQRQQGDQLTDILYEWESLQGNHDDASIDRKRVLLGELSEMARAEVVENAEETREDRRELREDRRETREDRRIRR